MFTNKVFIGGLNFVIYLKLSELINFNYSLYYFFILSTLNLFLCKKNHHENFVFLFFNLILSLFLVRDTFPYTANHYFLVFFLYLAIFLNKIFKEKLTNSVRIIIGLTFLFAGINKTINHHYRSGSFISQSILSQRLYDKVIPDHYKIIKKEDIRRLYEKKNIQIEVPHYLKYFLYFLVFGSIFYQFLMAYALFFEKTKYYDVLFITHSLITIMGTTEYIFGSILSLCFYLLREHKVYLYILGIMLVFEFWKYT